MFYVVYRVADGTEYSLGRVARAEDLPALQPEFGVKAYDTEPDRSRLVWDPVSLDYVARPAVQRAGLTPDEFWDRLTGAELVAIEGASRANTANGYQVAVAVKSLDRAAVLDVSLPRIRAALQVFVTRGLLTVGRLNEITTPVVEP